MRIAFMGTPDFAVPALLALHEAGHDVVAVYSQPPRPAGRGQAVRKSPVQTQAERLGIEVRTPIRLKNDAAAHGSFAALQLDVAVVAAYGLILPEPLLSAPERGCLNIHASLLPRWRGAAPYQAALLAGDAETGVTIMQMDRGLDTGPMLRRGSLPIGPRTDSPALHDALSALGARLIVQELADRSQPTPQDPSLATTVPRLTRADGRLDWTHGADSLDRRIRAMHPWPGTMAMLGDVVLKIAAATPLDLAHDAPPGTVLDDALTIACGTGALRLDRLQWPGRAMLPAADFLRGRAIPSGTVLA